MSLSPSYGIMLFEEKTHTYRGKKNTYTHRWTHTHTNGHRGRECTFDSSEMVDLLMAVTVRHHGWFTWTQPHLSVSRLFLPLYRRQMFTGSYQPPPTPHPPSQNNIEKVCWEKKTHTGRDGEKDVTTNNGKKARDNSEIDRLPVGDSIRQ